MNINTNSLDKAETTTKVDYSQCHSEIITSLMKFSHLPSLLERSARVRAAAQEAMEFFRGTVHEHHSEEEWDLFPAVLDHATPGEEFERVKAMVNRLTMEHRLVESLWTQIEPDLEKMARGEPGQVDQAIVETIVLDYGAHAAYEEAEFLPLCRHILGRGKDPYDNLDVNLDQGWDVHAKLMPLGGNPQ